MLIACIRSDIMVGFMIGIKVSMRVSVRFRVGIGFNGSHWS